MHKIDCYYFIFCFDIPEASRKDGKQQETVIVIEDSRRMATAATPLSPPEQQVAEFLSDILNLETIEVGFNCFLTHRPEITKANHDNFKEEFVKLMRKLGAESQGNVDTAVKYFLAQTAANSNSKKLEQLFDILQHAVNHHAVPARLACDNILNCDKLVRIISQQYY